MSFFISCVLESSIWLDYVYSGYFSCVVSSNTAGQFIASGCNGSLYSSFGSISLSIQVFVYIPVISLFSPFKDNSTSGLISSTNSC